MRWLWVAVVVWFTGVVQAAPAPVLLVLGDSLSTAWGLPAGDGWVSLLRARLAAQGYPHRVVNASIAGETSRGALARLPAILEDGPVAVAVVELGGNDALRGVPLEELERNLTAIVESLRDAGARVLLVPMRMPPNFGPVWTQRFAALYERVARRTGAHLAPFILDGIATEPALMQRDGLHPTAAAQPRMLDNLWPSLERLLRPDVVGLPAVTGTGSRR